ncbi:MAG: exosome complex protein Rrp42 [Desulfurococcaceae archaeon]
MSITPEREPLPKMHVDYILKSIKRGERLDGRGLLDFRQVQAILNPIEKAEGSALVKLGKTQVIVGIKTDLDKPFRDRPSEGILQVHTEFVPLASPSFEPGPPDENSIEAARIIDRSLREPKVIKLEDLVVEPGKLVWVIYNDVYLVDYHGNIVDASMIASMLALAGARLPSLTMTEDGYQVNRGVKDKPIPISTLVATVTMGVIGEVVFVDPTLEEEAIADALITVAVDERGSICGAQKRGEKGVSRSTLEKSVEIALDKGKWLIDYMKNILNNPQEYIKPLSKWGA